MPRGPADAFWLAVAHHDDGWAGRDANVCLGPDGGPETFLDVAFADHLTLSDASVRTASALHPYAGAVVARHVAWLHGARPVAAGALADQRDALVETWTAAAAEQAAAVGVDESALDHDQRLCAMVDFVSLWLCGWPGGDAVEVARPGGTVLGLTRDGDAVHAPASWLPAAGSLTVAVTHVAPHAPFAIVDAGERRVHLTPAG